MSKKSGLNRKKIRKDFINFLNKNYQLKVRTTLLFKLRHI